MELVQKVMAAHQHGIDMVIAHGKLDLLKKGGTLREALDTGRRITAEDITYQRYSGKEKGNI